MTLFIGKFFPHELLKSLPYDSLGKAGMSNHNFEMSIINGLCKQSDIHLLCLTIPGVYSFPYNNRKLYTKAESYRYDNTSVYSAGFCNIAVIKEIWSTISLCCRLIQLVYKCKEEKVDVIVNTPDNRLLNAVRIMKAFTKKRITQTVIIPDIPSMVTAMDEQNSIKAFILKILNRRAMIQTSRSDGLVLLTESMLDLFKCPALHIVMEGIIDLNTMDMTSIAQSERKVILYTGTLRKIFGVMNLVQAFRLVTDPDAELWICGSGDSKEAIEEAAKQDTRIKFWGLVDSRKAIELQHQAMVLVNPRTSEGDYTKYSFPSKTIEYLLSGKSTIINRLPGIPEEYYNYVYTPKDESVEALAECINEVLHMDSDVRTIRSKSGRDFVILHKDSITQTRRILDMISKY